MFEQWVQLRCRLELGDEIGIEVFEMREPKTSPSDWAIGLKQFIRETKGLVFRFFFETSFEQENDEIYDNRTWFKKSFIMEELSSHGKANKLITRLWDEYNKYDESTARIYAESIRRSINTQSSESKITTIEAKIVKFPRIGEHLLSDLIAHRKTWLFATDGVKVPRFEGREFFPKHAYSKLKINNHVNDKDTDSEVRLGLLPLSHAFKLRQNLVENSDTTSIFDGNIRLKETLEIIEAMEPLVYKNNSKYVREFHDRLNLAWELLRKIGALFDYRDFDPKGRFRWLNDPGFYSAIVTSVFEMMEANKVDRQSEKPPILLGSDAVYLPASYIFYHAKFKLGRNLSRYIESLEVLSRHFPGSMAIINPGRKALQAYLLEVVDEKSPLKDEEFNFLLASIRNVGKDFLEAKQMRSLGFTESQINRYKF